MSAGWRSEALADVCEIKPPKGEAKRKLKDADFVSFVPMEDLGIDQKYLEPKAERKLGQVAGSYTYFADGDVLLAKITPCFENGKLGIARGLTNGIGFGSSEYIVFRPNSELSNEYLYYFLLQDSFRANGVKTMSGAVGHKRVSKAFVERCHIPLPSFPEQQRIVAILDEAFTGLATATANAEKNLKNARELFDSYLTSIFAKRHSGWIETTLGAELDLLVGFAFKSPQYTKDPDGISLLRGDNVIQNALRWDDVKLWPATDAAKYQNYLLEPGDVVLAMDRTWVMAGLKYAVIREADVPCLLVQRVARLRCRAALASRFLVHLIGSSRFTKYVLGIQTGLSVPHISGKQIGDFVFWKPSISEQQRIGAKLDNLASKTAELEQVYRAKLSNLATLRQSILQGALSGELGLTRVNVTSHTTPSFQLVSIAGISPTDLHAGIIAIAYQKHQGHPKQNTFGHVKAEKVAHMVEARVGIELERNPIKDAAGPNDYRHLKKVESRAEKAGFFSVKRLASGGYTFTPKNKFDELVAKTRACLGDYNEVVDAIIEELLPMNSQQAEIFATVYAAWNNLLLDGKPADDEAIVREAREDWHPEKLKIDRDRLFVAIDWMRRKGIVPTGIGKKVLERSQR